MTNNFKIADADKSLLETLFMSIEQVDLSIRLSNVLKREGIKYLGELSLIDFTDFLRQPNVGRNTINELKKIQIEYNIVLPKFEWPTDSEIQQLINDRNLNPGKSFAIDGDGAKTIEGEVTNILKKIIPNQHIELVLNRLGINVDWDSMTLRELAESGFIGDKPVTRERARQVLKKCSSLMERKKFIAPILNNVIIKIKSAPIVNIITIQEEIIKEGWSSSPEPLKLIENLIEFGFSGQHISKIRIPWVNQTFVINEGSDSEIELYNLFMEIREQTSGSVFAQLENIDYEKYNYIDKKLAIELVKSCSSLAYIETQNDYFVAKIPRSLDVTGNKINASMAKVFAVTNVVGTSTFHQAIQKTRNFTQKIPLDAFVSLIKEYKFLEVSEVEVRCLKRPTKNPLNESDYLVIEAVKQFGNLIDTTTLHKFLVSKGLTSGAARQIPIFSPLIINIKKGHRGYKGYYSFICDVGEIDILQKTESTKASQPDNEKFCIPNNAKTRVVGLHLMDHKSFDDGSYDIFDQHDNLICSINVQGLQMRGLQPIAKTTNEDIIELHFDREQQAFFTSLK